MGEEASGNTTDGNSLNWLGYVVILVLGMMIGYLFMSVNTQQNPDKLEQLSKLLEGNKTSDGAQACMVSANKTECFSTSCANANPIFQNWTAFGLDMKRNRQYLVMSGNCVKEIGLSIEQILTPTGAS